MLLVLLLIVLVGLFAYVPVVAAAVFILLSAVIFALNWQSEGKWGAIKDAVWSLLTKW